MDDEGLFLPSEIRALKTSVSWFQRLSSFLRFFSPSSFFPSSYSLLLMCFTSSFFPFLFFFHCDKSKWLFFLTLACVRLELSNGPDAFHCEEKLGKGNFEIKRTDHFSFLKFFHFWVGLICGLGFVWMRGVAVASNSVLAHEALSFLSVVKTQQGMFGVAGFCCPQCCPHCHTVPVVAHPVLTTLPSSSQGWPKVSCGPHAVPSIVCVWLLCVGVWELDSMDGKLSPACQPQGQHHQLCLMYWYNHNWICFVGGVLLRRNSIKQIEFSSVSLPASWAGSVPQLIFSNP